MKLPPRHGGPTPALPAESRQILIVGANGAGKTRFTSHMARSCAEGTAFAMSPLRALFGAYDSAAEAPTIDRLYARAMRESPFGEATAASTELERLLGLLLQEEMTTLLAYKMQGAEGPLPDTKLDRVLTLWRNIFPDNDVLRHEGSLLFASRADGGKRSQMKLSAGEKVVLYYFGAVLFAPTDGMVFIDSPELFLHPSTLRRVWDRVEALRPDCTFIYTTHDLDFAATRSAATTVWVRGCNPEADTFDYDILPADSDFREEMYLSILGARRPVLFIEGDNTHSIDSKLYPLIFPDFTVRALGSCDRVIESTRVFNSLNSFHHLDSRGIVDRDRRNEHEVEYLRRKNVMVPEVAEIENLLMLEEVVRTVAAVHRRDEQRAFDKVKTAVMSMFKADLRQQALLHTRHSVKHTMEHRIDGRFASINKLEEHLEGLLDEINPRAIYEQFCREFNRYVREDDYAAVLRVYNQKSMVGQSNVSSLTGCGDKRSYLTAVLNILKTDSPAAARIRSALRANIL